ncbi:MAG: nucleotidyltransferase family protein [Desulfobacteraceae bacterium]|nr:nucleotidyltransferase family protein [Desulfobacteraceae bacterium]
MPEWLNNIRPEQKFVLDCIGKSESSNLDDIIHASFDWDYCVNFALQNRLIPLLYIAIKNKKIKNIPDDTLKDLKQSYLSNLKRNLIFSGKLIAIIKLFETNDIQIIPLKGPVIAEFVYGDLALRSFSDLDVLIDVKDCQKAYKLLIDNNYIPELELNNTQINQYSKTEDNLSFFIKNGIALELHWELSGRKLPYAFDFNSIKNHLPIESFFNQNIYSITDDYLAIYLALHSSKHNWENLEQIFCISKLLENKEITFWDNTLFKAKQLKCRRIFLLGAGLSNEIYDIEIPNKIKLLIKQDNGLNKNITMAINKLFNDDMSVSCSNVPISSYHINLNDSFYYKILFVIRYLILPTKQDWKKFKLLPHLSFLLYILRPIRLFFEWFKL